MTSHRPTLLRRALLGLGAAVVGAVGVIAVLAFGGSSTVVEILVDDTRHEVSLSHGTVADALGMAGVVVGPEDLVTPDPDTEVAGPLRVFVTRAITVEVVVDDQAPLTVTAPVSSVGGALAASGLAVSGLQALRDEGAVVSPAWRSPVEDGDTITVRRPVEVIVEVDGDEFTVVSLAAHVEDVLQLHDVELGPDDLVTPPPTAGLGDDSIVVQRIGFEEEVEEVVLPHGEVRRETADLERGTTEVAQEGRDGLRRDRYRIRFADGDQTGREVLSRDVVRAPEARIVLVGTAAPAPEPPPPAPSTSTSSSTSTPSSSSAAASSGVPALDDPVWDRLAQCESNGNWQMNSGNGFYGGLQFMLETWRGVGGQGYPHEASREEQIRRARLLLEPDAWWATFGHQFPHCSRLLGLH